MSFWKPNNTEGIPIEQGTYGPKLGILGSFERAYNTSVQINSQYGAEIMLRDLESENRKRISDAGIKPPPPLDDQAQQIGIGPEERFQNPFESWYTSYYTDYLRTGNSGERDHELQKLREQHPELGIMTYDEMKVRMHDEAQKRLKEANFPQTWPGMLGGFVGGIAGAMTPTANPFNVLTLGMGGGGKTVLQRLATQGGIQAGVETINQFTGVQENRQFLGLPKSTPGEIAGDIAMAGLGGVAFQGVFGEALPAAFRYGKRWLTGSPIDPAPPPHGGLIPRAPPSLVRRHIPGPAERFVGPLPSDLPYRRAPLSEPPEARPPPLQLPPGLEMAIRAAGSDPVAATRLGRARVSEDVVLAARHLDEWSGPQPRDLPTTDTALPAIMREGIPQPKMFDPAAFTHSYTIDELARRVDPKLFDIYDKLVSQRDSFKRDIDQFYRLRELQLGIGPIDEELNALTERMLRQDRKGQPLVTPRIAKKYEARIAELKAKREELLAQPIPAGMGIDTPGMTASRLQAVQADNELRKLAPAISRAYSRAQSKWTAYDEQNKAIQQMVLQGKPGLGENPYKLSEKIPEEPPRPTMQDFAPELLDPRAATTEGKIPDKNPGETVLHVQSEQAKEAAKVLEEFQKKAGMLAERVTPEERLNMMDKGKPDPNTINVAGQVLHLDEMTVPDGEGNTISLRQALEQIDDDKYALEAIAACSIVPTS